MHSDADLATEAFRAGASGYLLKQSAGEELITAVHTVLKGQVYLTPLIQQEVLEAFMKAGSEANKASVELTARQREVLQHGRRRSHDEGDHYRAERLDPHGGVSQVRPDGKTGPPNDRRADSIRHQTWGRLPVTAHKREHSLFLRNNSHQNPVVLQIDLAPSSTARLPHRRGA